MKRKSDPRHKLRIKNVKTLFEKKFRTDVKVSEDPNIKEIIAHLKQIDSKIAKNAPAWPINQISPLDLSVLRLAVWELLYSKKKEPYKVIVDEAVEISKEYGSETSASFVNGVLGTIIKSRQKDLKSKHA